MYTAYLILFTILGLIIGSFLNVVIFRMDDLKTILYDRSHCPNCKQILKWYDLVPFLSFFLLRAKCRYCGKSISWQYPIVEVGTGILFAFLYMYFGLTSAFFFYLIVFSLFVIIFVYDIRKQLIPDNIAWIVLVLSALGGWYFNGLGIASAVWGIVIGGGILAFLVIVSKEKWMGAGDIKIGAAMGALVGYQGALLGTFLAFLLGSIVGLVYIKVANKTMKDSLPFAPFIIVSTLFVLVYGSVIINWYMNAFSLKY